MSPKPGAQHGDSLSINKFYRLYFQNLNLAELHKFQDMTQNGDSL
jgi:hypothetical protein